MSIFTFFLDIGENAWNLYTLCKEMNLHNDQTLMYLHRCKNRIAKSTVSSLLIQNVRRVQEVYVKKIKQDGSDADVYMTSYVL